jgi:hypothetical protein
MEESFVDFDTGDEGCVEPVKPPEKKKPGRPKKNVVKKTVPKEGIVQVPVNIKLEESNPMSVNVLEIVYDNPVMFKKIFHLLKVMAVENVKMSFDAQGIRMYAADHLVKNRIFIQIFGNRINRYYCERPLEFGCLPSRIGEKLAPLTKDHGKIVIATNRQYCRSRITMVLVNDQMDEDGVDNIEVDEAENFEWSVEDVLEKEESYPIKFELPSKHFKKKISDFSRACDILRIEKTGFEYLRFSYNHGDKRGRHDSYFKNSGLINLRSMLEEDDIFSVSVFLEHIKPLASALIADELHISADKKEDLIFTAYLDQEEREVPGKQKKYKVAGTEKCVIKVVTSIVRSKREVEEREGK